MPAVRKTMEEKIGNVYKGLDLTLECFPEDHVQDDPQAFLKVCVLHTGLVNGACTTDFESQSWESE
jgi:hypothetical protein